MYQQIAELQYEVARFQAELAMYKQVYERQCEISKNYRHDLELREKQLEELTAALVAKDGAIESAAMHVRPTCDDVYYALKEALTIQPHEALVAKLKVEAVTEFLEREEKWTINEAILAKIKADAVREAFSNWEFAFADDDSLYQATWVRVYADRIERGEV